MDKDDQVADGVWDTHRRRDLVIAEKVRKDNSYRDVVALLKSLTPHAIAAPKSDVVTGMRAIELLVAGRESVGSDPLRQQRSACQNNGARAA